MAVASAGVELDIEVLDDACDTGQGKRESRLDGEIRMLFVLVGVLRPINIATQVVSKGEGPWVVVHSSGMISSFGSTMMAVISVAAGTSTGQEPSGAGSKVDLGCSVDIAKSMNN